jgi:FKBP-type peptidyl-prolyl cis-trans isomerase
LFSVCKDNKIYAISKIFIAYFVACSFSLLSSVLFIFSSLPFTFSPHESLSINHSLNSTHLVHCSMFHATFRPFIPSPFRPFFSLRGFALPVACSLLPVAIFPSPFRPFFSLRGLSTCCLLPAACCFLPLLSVTYYFFVACPPVACSLLPVARYSLPFRPFAHTPFRHCEVRSNPVRESLSAVFLLDCFTAFAMTGGVVACLPVACSLLPVAIFPSPFRPFIPFALSSLRPFAPFPFKPCNFPPSPFTFPCILFPIFVLTLYFYLSLRTYIMYNYHMTQEEKKSYVLGVTAALNYVEMGIKINEAAFIKGFSTVINDQKPELSEKEILQTLDAINTDLENESKSQTQGEKEKGRKFLEENRQKYGVKETHSGLQYKVIKESIGKKPTPTDTVEVHYHGKLLDGTVFDSSVERGEKISFSLNQVIEGWREGLQLMSEGSKFEFYIPSHLAYGDKGAGESIKGGATLIFEVELFKVN